MSLNDVTGVVGGILIPLLGLVALYRAPGRLQAQVKHEAEILANLPSDSTAYALLLEQVERRVAVMTRQPRMRRNARGAVGASGILLFAGVMLLIGTQSEGWTRAVYLTEAAVTAIFGVVAFVEALAIAQRDYRGQRVKTA